MKDDICTIPISDVFEQRCGCPFCEMHLKAEQKAMDYIMGAAMMEPDVRVKTNELGFCGHHYDEMSKRSERLSIGLLLKSRLEELENNIKKEKSNNKNNSDMYPHSRVSGTCFICDKMEWALSRMYETVYITYAKENDFRELFAKQEYVCYNHYNFLLINAKKNILKKEYNSFITVAGKLTANKANQLKNCIEDFCNIFDYQKSQEYSEEKKNLAKESVKTAMEYDSDHKF